MFFTKTIFITLISTATISAIATPPSIDRFRHELENEIYERDMAEMGFTRREDHPYPQKVAHEIEEAVGRYVVKRMSSIHVDCHTLLEHCSINTECSLKSGECAGCNPHSHKCQEDRP